MDEQAFLKRLAGWYKPRPVAGKYTVYSYNLSAEKCIMPDGSSQFIEVARSEYKVHIGREEDTDLNNSGDWIRLIPFWFCTNSSGELATVTSKRAMQEGWRYRDELTTYLRGTASAHARYSRSMYCIASLKDIPTNWFLPAWSEKLANHFLW
jgi:hypothetical protein